ncbi:MAG: PKD domain-containing protein [Rhodothermales bacterium]
MKRYILGFLFVLPFVGLSAFTAASAQDRDGDGHNDAVDNCPWMSNGLQVDYNANGIGDNCEGSVFLTRKSRSVFFGSSRSEGRISGIVPELPGGAQINILRDESGFNSRIADNDLVMTYEDGSQGGDVILEYSIGVESVTDTLSVRLMSSFPLTRIEGGIQNGYLPIHYSNRIEYLDGLYELEENPPFHFEFVNPVLESAFLVKDLNEDGINDLIGGIPTIYNVRDNSYEGVARLLVPLYLTVDHNLNIIGYHENIAYPESMFHNQDWGQGPSIAGKTDTLFSLGEHYHSPIFPDWQGPADISDATNILEMIGINEGVHYDDWGFKRHHFTTFINGRAVTNFKAIDSSQLDQMNNSPFVNPLSYAFGDVDNDGQAEWLIGSQVRSEQGTMVLDVISRVNERLVVTRTHLDPFGYTVSAEGAMILMDINGDGWKDLVFNDYWSDPQSGESPLGILFNYGGQFDYSNPTWIDNPFPGLEMKEAIIDDFDENGVDELLIHWAMLYPDSFRHLYDGGVPVTNRLAVYQVQGATLVENTSAFIPEYATSSPTVGGHMGGAMMSYIDIDGDGRRDIHVSYTTPTDESGSGEIGGWKSGFGGAWYFSRSPEGSFQWKEIGTFEATTEMRSAYSSPREFMIGNQLQPVDLDGNGVAEFIHHGFYDGGLGFSIYRKSGAGFNLPPITVAQVDSRRGQAPISIHFNASASTDPNGDALTFAWDFGDGATGSGETASHTYTAAGEYTVVLTASDGVLTGTDSLTVSIASGVDKESFELPETFVLRAAYPNPFNPTTTVTYGVPAAAEVRITATDLLGRQVATLVSGDMKAAGYHTVQFNADGLASGTYLIRMEAGDFVATQQVVLLK